MKVSFIQPRTELQPYIESFWVFESVVGMRQTDSSIAAPNDCSKLLISRAILAALIVGVAFGAYSEMAMVRVEGRSTVSPPASVLWKIMMEVDKYPEWYGAMLEASGTPRLGSKLRFRVKAMNGSTRQFSFTGIVVEFEPERKLAWTGGTFPILVGRHFFEFVPMRDGKTQVIQGEEFRGLYPLFAGRKKMLALTPAYEQFNRELADRAAHRHE